MWRGKGKGIRIRYRSSEISKREGNVIINEKIIQGTPFLLARMGLGGGALKVLHKPKESNIFHLLEQQINEPELNSLVIVVNHEARFRVFFKS